MTGHRLTRIFATSALAISLTGGITTSSQAMPLPVTSAQEIAGTASTEQIRWWGGYGWRGYGWGWHRPYYGAGSYYGYGYPAYYGGYGYYPSAYYAPTYYGYYPRRRIFYRRAYYRPVYYRRAYVRPVYYRRAYRRAYWR